MPLNPEQKKKLPKSGEQFRLVADGVMIFAENGNDPQVRTLNDEYDYEDGSWWTLEETERENKYLVVAAPVPPLSGMTMYVDDKYVADNPRLFRIGLKNQTPPLRDQLWEIMFKDDHSNLFILKNYPDDRPNAYTHLYFTDEPGSAVGASPAGPRKMYFYTGQPFVKKVTYLLNPSPIITKNPTLIATQTYRNSSSAEQHSEIESKYTKTTEHHWEYSGGFKITGEVNMTFNAGVPFVAEGGLEVKIGAETEHTWTNTTVKTETEEKTYKFPLTIPAGKMITATIMIDECTADVPYEMVMGYKNTDKTSKSTGKWVGTQCVNVRVDIVHEEDC